MTHFLYCEKPTRQMHIPHIPPTCYKAHEPAINESKTSALRHKHTSGHLSNLFALQRLHLASNSEMKNSSKCLKKTFGGILKTNGWLAETIINISQRNLQQDCFSSLKRTRNNSAQFSKRRNALINAFHCKKSLYLYISSHHLLSAEQSVRQQLCAEAAFTKLELFSHQRTHAINTDISQWLDGKESMLTGKYRMCKTCEAVTYRADSWLSSQSRRRTRKGGLNLKEEEEYGGKDDWRFTWEMRSSSSTATTVPCCTASATATLCFAFIYTHTLSLSLSCFHTPPHACALHPF